MCIPPVCTASPACLPFHKPAAVPGHWLIYKCFILQSVVHMNAVDAHEWRCRHTQSCVAANKQTYTRYGEMLSAQMLTASPAFNLVAHIGDVFRVGSVGSCITV
jgi:hypothetical protein